jgi:putative FmdB family regulatory protein
MPIYEYRCKQCGKVSEILVGVGPDNSSLACQHCGSHDLQKILSVSSFTFSESSRAPGTTCCGREERCDTPPCTTGDICRREQ